MRIDVLGAGPAGLYFSILMKRADPAHRVRVFERNAPDATFGWGVVFSEGSLDDLETADPESHAAITEAWARWDPIDVRYQDTVTRIRGNGFSGVARRRLLGILQDRAREVGVELVFQHEVERLDEHLRADLVIGADGVNSMVRRTYAGWLRPTVTEAGSKYAWYGADLAFPVFTYIFKATEWGPFQAHCYPFDAARSTMIVLVPEATWRRAGLDSMDEAESLAFCERVFATELGGRRMLSNHSLWVNFPWISCATWHTDNVVLMGDSAHTAHWSIGSGTKLALEDAMALARACQRQRDLKRAVADYELERQPAVERLQEAARISLDYFEGVQRYFHFEPPQFAYQLMTRARITHQNLQVRDPEFVREIEAWWWERTAGERVAAAPPPAFSPLRLAGLTLRNRLVVTDGRSGAALTISAPHAVSAEGRWSPATPVEIAAPEPGRLTALQIGHAGRRGACRPARDGVDRPLPRPWPLVSASALPYAAWSPEPAALDRAGMERVRDDFVAAAARALAAGHRALLLDFARGGLIASFISPLANLRTDEFGAGLAGRLRFPLEVLRAVREVWPDGLPLLVAYTAADHARGGLSRDDSLATATALGQNGADALLVLTGQSVAEGAPDYGRLYGVPYADRVRNTARVPVIGSGRISTLDEVNTLIAAGRADLCVLDRPRPRSL
ncbi:MAG: FAD-dependent monooxygenase [Candidatus Dormibacteraeota bacterium]|nr:FAD-dependent monooxygenase [Candidatus Dormibacteraeota bacterium]